ncbi:MAG: DISARM system phospholipase D-like protein DrmC [Anaerolineae bacterium]
MTIRESMAQTIHWVVADLPTEMVVALATSLEESDQLDWPKRRLIILSAIPQPAIRERISTFLDLWQTTMPTVSAQSVALALSATAKAVAAEREQERLELVWTGPDSRLIPLRRTDQALLQLIDEARRSLHIVSFAVYRVDAIAQALVRAAQRGIAIAVYLETPDSSEGRVAYDTMRALGEDVIRYARLYVWPLDQRPRTQDGRHGSLHAKIAIADERVMLISSANLTEYAMSLNMEMGVIVHGGALPAQAAAHLARLVENRIFQLIDSAL